VIIVDTSVWIVFFRGSNQQLVDKLGVLIDNSEVVALSCVFGELLQGVKNESEEKTILDVWNNLSRVDERNLFIEAGQGSAKYKFVNRGVGLIDSYILAAALKYNLLLWTFDKKLNDAYSTMLLG
jgi:predicted nucleic acid-binding protein